MKFKIINIINHPPAYEEYSDKPRPATNWDTPDGNWVGIWGYDWADQISAEIIKISNKFDCEVWQPDLRADKIYSHTFENGLVHRMFPAINREKDIFSPLMISQLLSIPQKDIIFLLTPPAYDPFSLNIYCNLTKSRNLFIIATHLGEFRLPIFEFFKLRKRITRYWDILKIHFAFKKGLQSIDGIIYINNKWIKYLTKIYRGPVRLIPCGVDFVKWNKGDKKSSRFKLKLPFEKKIFLTSSRLLGIKQIDILLKVFNSVHCEKDYLLVIAGHGTRSYEEYLRQIAKPLIEQNKVLFAGYVAEDELVLYYQAADFFIHTSMTEGSPVSVQKAFACELPVITTDVGYTAEILKVNNAGVVLPIKEYKEWKSVIQDSLNGKIVKTLDMQVAFNNFAWQKIADNYINFIDLVRENAISK